MLKLHSSFLLSVYLLPHPRSVQFRFAKKQHDESTVSGGGRHSSYGGGDGDGDDG